MKASSKHSARLLTGLAVLVLLLVIGLNSFIFSRIAQNGSGQGYSMPGCSMEAGITGILNPIEKYVMEGAGYFLKANADIHAFLHIIEWQDLKVIDYNELDRLATNALANIMNARETYELLVKIATATPYNPEVISLLKNFDYDSFREKHDLDPVVFTRVREYLENGNITGSFEFFHANIISIEKMLLEIQSKLVSNSLPELPLTWKLNEMCAETLLFGSFTARIFYSLN